MSSGVPVHVIVAVFEDGSGASNALQALRASQTRALVGIVDAAVIVRGAHGTLELRETAARERRRFALSPVAAGVVAMVTGPDVGESAGGALFQDLARRLTDGGFPAAPLRDAAAELAGCSSVLVVVAETAWTGAVAADLSREASIVVVEGLPGDLARELGAAGELVYTADREGRPLLVEQRAPGASPASSQAGGLVEPPVPPDPAA